MSHRTPLYEHHVAAGARMVPFADHQLPLHYGSQLEEHHAVRTDCGIFDVSHMAITDLVGAGARELLRGLLANDVARLDAEEGRALYSCLLNEDGGIIDDLIVYRRAEEDYRIVSNAATRARVRPLLEAAGQRAEVSVHPRDDLAMIAVQGPRAAEVLTQTSPSAAERGRALRPFRSVEADGAFLARTGYTGEEGFELILEAPQAGGWWEGLTAHGATPCGLGARDSLRLEAGLLLNGQDMDEETTPLEAGLEWTVAWEPGERVFQGRDALERQRSSGPPERTIGLLLEGRALPRPGHGVVGSGGEGRITSGGFGPTVGAPIALARVPATATAPFHVAIRGREIPAREVTPPFVRHGRVQV